MTKQQEKLAIAAEQARAEQAERELARLRAEHEKSRSELTASLSRLAKVREEARGVIVTYEAIRCIAVATQVVVHLHAI